MDIARLKTDPAREDEGVWVEVGDGASLKLARIGNRRYREATQRRFKPYRRALRAGTLSEATSEQLMAEVLAETVLLDWRGLMDRGTPVPYSVDQAKAVLCDPAYREFRDLVVELAGDMQSYREADLEDAEKNLGTSSSGTSTGANG